MRIGVVVAGGAWPPSLSLLPEFLGTVVRLRRAASLIGGPCAVSHSRKGQGGFCAYVSRQHLNISRAVNICQGAIETLSTAHA